jgi:Ca-activated chloride channel family protein
MEGDAFEGGVLPVVVEQFIHNRPNDLIGVVTFARYADTLSPLTFGHDALIEIVRQLTIQDRPNEDGTAYGDALTLACARLEQMKEWQTSSTTAAADRTAAIRSQVVVLLTDGENNCGLHLPEEAAGLAKKWGIRVYAISLTGDGPAAPATADAELTPAEKLLQHLASETGGNYWKIGNAPQLQAVYDEIDRLEKSQIKNATLYHTEISPLFSWFALPALVLLLVERILSATWLRVAEDVRR